MSRLSPEPPYEVAGIEALPRYSPWPARLLGSEPWADRRKTRAEILREFDQEKWGALWARFSENPAATVDDVEAWEADPDERALVTGADDRWCFMTRVQARHAYHDMVAASLAKYFPAQRPPAIVELGCGFGSIVLRMAQRPVFRGIPFMAAELTPSGQALTGALAANAGVDLTVGECDLAASPITSLPVPSGAVIYTSYAAHYLPTGHRGFIEAVAALRPSVVLHFEPIYRHADPTTTLGLMRRRYIEVNDYTRDILEQLEAAGVRLLAEVPCVFGQNPLLPVSLLAWAPAGV